HSGASTSDSVSNRPTTAGVATDFDFEANASRQDELREQAALVAEALAEAMTAVEQARSELQAAQEDLEARRRLHEQGVLADSSMQAAEERVGEAEAAAGTEQQRLKELQSSYARLAREIRELEEAAEQARAEQSVANEAAPAAPPEPAAETETVQLREQPSARRAPDLPAAGRAAPREVRDLAAPRYHDITAPGHAMVAGVVSPEGKLVEVDDELLRLSNIQLARLTARVSQDYLPEFREGRALTVSFEDYPSVQFEGWVASAEGAPGSDEADVELLVVCDAGARTDDAYLALQWMVLEAGVDADVASDEPIAPVMEPAPKNPVTRLLQRIFPLLGPEDKYAARLDAPEVERRDLYEGRLRLQPMPRISEEESGESTGDERLAALEQWRRSYLEGMVTTILDDGTAITYPARGEVSEAVRKMLAGRVSHDRNLCARTMREALGWGLGDAHAWAWRLPHRGYRVRRDGLPRPGDILVWPFTYGPRHTQHIGVAVRQGRKLVLLSNLSGRLGTSELLGGYIAFYRPEDQPSAGDKS
ncbi:MAG: hypothetical protein J7M38_10525, partial [Armatimonadetes bacterium]|nr:hypothetical protein [Armatimonadota bacterium]